MKLPDLHRRLLSDALTCGNTYGLVLAGGYAIQAHNLVSRLSQDLDLATNAAAGMTEIAQTLVSGLEEKGWAISVVEIAPPHGPSDRHGPRDQRAVRAGHP